MKVAATSLLLAATLVFIVTRALEDRWSWLGYVRATAEAAMVGALADWFAVTALFRHPLGLPIPHTAIIPNRKDQLGPGPRHVRRRRTSSPPAVAVRAAAVGRRGAAARGVAGRAGARAPAVVERRRAGPGR